MVGQGAGKGPNRASDISGGVIGKGRGKPNVSNDSHILIVEDDANTGDGLRVLLAYRNAVGLLISRTEYRRGTSPTIDRYSLIHRLRASQSNLMVIVRHYF
jgi:hypothetical protein